MYVFLERRSIPLTKGSLTQKMVRKHDFVQFVFELMVLGKGGGHESITSGDRGRLREVDG